MVVFLLAIWHRAAAIRAFGVPIPVVHEFVGLCEAQEPADLVDFVGVEVVHRAQPALDTFVEGLLSEVAVDLLHDAGRVLLEVREHGEHLLGDDELSQRVFTDRKRRPAHGSLLALGTHAVAEFRVVRDQVQAENLLVHLNQRLLCLFPLDLDGLVGVQSRLQMVHLFLGDLFGRAQLPSGSFS